MSLLDTVEQQIETLQAEVKAAMAPAAAPTPEVTTTPTPTSAVTTVAAPAGNVSPIIQMAINQAKERFAREGGK